MLDKALLRSKMAAHEDTQKTLAAALGISLSRLNAKINEADGAEFKQAEISLMKQRYDLSPAELNDIFFAAKMS